MGRKATVNLNLPTGMRARKRKTRNGIVTWYYFDTGGKPRKEIPLGNDYVKACQKWSELSLQKLDKAHQITFVQALQRYILEVIPKKAPKTQRNNIYHTKRLKLFFGGDNPVLLEDIDAGHIREYFKWRYKAPVAANREIALFNHIWTYCRPAHWGYTSKESPSKDIKRNKEQPRDVYVEDYIYSILYKYGSQDLRDAMEIAMMLGQRPCDTAKIHTDHIQKGVLTIKQNKTSNALRFVVTKRLQDIITRRAPHGGFLFLNNRKRKMTTDNLQYRFDIARSLAIQNHPEHAEELAQIQFRDLRAKSATDKSLVSSEEEASKLLGHASVNITKKVYIRRTLPIIPFEHKGDEIAEQV
ncbi:tyrosine-type recombinase/integrase [Snodgrassella sp. ESL0253]|uniref:tyrosine-type recombinase/integrase n=1 Tax=Snodgrassella sp. ESL0253 TaxID=2705031 RepID=UPI0015826A8E|nr:tyrosine-type recombinase/integrase [Snodgrassella sp. ESL0253]NUE67264.1 tyrosine-type recombinase/integrase [Snodgrassella sp. ESL0253]